MVPPLKLMSRWTPSLENELTLLIKDWLKSQGMTQADLRNKLCAPSSRMPVLLEVLRKEYKKGGIPGIAKKLCSIESEWSTSKDNSESNQNQADPFNQLDLILEELREDIED